MNTDSNLLECPICFDYFIKPRILTNCGHTFCEKCIIDMISTLSENIDSELYIICPTCNVKTQFQTIHNLKQNYIVSDLVEQLIRHKTNSFKLNQLSSSCPNSSIIHSLKQKNIIYETPNTTVEPTTNNINISTVEPTNNTENINNSDFKFNNNIFIFEDVDDENNHSRDCCNILKPFSL